MDTASRSVRFVRVPPAAAMVLSHDNLRAYFVQLDEESDIWMLELREQ
jgi:hypothetical protein